MRIVQKTNPKYDQMSSLRKTGHQKQKKLQNLVSKTDKADKNIQKGEPTMLRLHASHKSSGTFDSVSSLTPIKKTQRVFFNLC